VGDRIGQRRVVRDDIEAYILAGGASRRMGTDKSQLLLQNESLIQRIKNTVEPVASRVRVVGLPRSEEGNIVPDIYPKWGALGGVHGALAACNSDWAMVVACDLPFITPELLLLLISLRNEHDAVVPIQADHRPQPLCALYRVNPCLKSAAQLIESGHRRPTDLLDAVNTRWVSFAELEHLQHSEHFFVNINTPEDYYEATQKVSAHQDLS
jgi:molybdopterin-guanine dinucleotide biosynthesis protein A